MRLDKSTNTLKQDFFQMGQPKGRAMKVEKPWSMDKHTINTEILVDNKEVNDQI